MPMIDYFKRNKQVPGVTNLEGKHANRFHKYTFIFQNTIKRSLKIPKG